MSEQKWISFSDRFPTAKDGRFLGFGDDGQIHECYMGIDNEPHDCNGWLPRRITHWWPFPPPPEL